MSRSSNVRSYLSIVGIEKVFLKRIPIFFQIDPTDRSGKTSKYPLVNDPISNIGEGTHPEIARTDRFFFFFLFLSKTKQNRNIDSPKCPS